MIGLKWYHVKRKKTKRTDEHDCGMEVRVRCAKDKEHGGDRGAKG